MKGRYNFDLEQNMARELPFAPSDHLFIRVIIETSVITVSNLFEIPKFTYAHMMSIFDVELNKQKVP